MKDIWISIITVYFYNYVTIYCNLRYLKNIFYHGMYI